MLRLLHRNRGRTLLLLLAALLVLGACSNKRVSRREAGEAIDLSGRWNDTDSRLVAEEMVRDSLSRPWIENHLSSAGERPVVVPYGVKNRTGEHINTRTFMNNLQRAFVNSGRVRVVSEAQQRETIREERADQQQGLTDDPAAIGRELGANFVLTGEINDIRDREDGEEVIYYQTNLEMVNVETNEIVWIGEKQIKKFIERDAVGL